MKLRSYRIFGLAVFDLVVAIVVCMIIGAIAYRPKYGIGILVGILVTIPLGILVHLLLNIPTTLNYSLGLSKKPKKH